MSGLCYWCESRGIMQCKQCTRNFCKFCIKNGHSQDETKRVCFICGCFEITGTNLPEVGSDGNNGNNNNNTSCLRDREMKDMLHRYEDLCSNDKLANTINDLLINIDAVTGDKLPIFFEVMKSNILSMLHDMQKVETMVNRATEDSRSIDIDQVLIPLLKVVTKHHVFKRLGRPQIFSDLPENGVPFSENNSHNNTDTDMGSKTNDSNGFIDLTDDDRMMDVSKTAASSTFDDSDNERMQRSPLCLAEEEKSTTKFEIQELHDDDNNTDIGATDYVDLSVVSSLSPHKNPNLSLVSSTQIDEQFAIKNSPQSHEFTDLLLFDVPMKNPIDEPEETKLTSKKRRSRLSSDVVVEKRSVRLRSETMNIATNNNNNSIDESESESFGNQNNFPTLQSNLSEAATMFTRGVGSPLLRSDTRKQLQQLNRSAKSPTKSSSISGSNNCKVEMLINDSPMATVKTMAATQLVKRSNTTNNNHRLSISPSSLSDSATATEQLNKFSKVLQRNKNSHLVCPAPLNYEKPFLLKPLRAADAIDDLRPPTTNKTWSWERQMPPTVVARSVSNGNDIKANNIVCKPIVIPKSIIEAGSNVGPTRGRPRLSVTNSSAVTHNTTNNHKVNKISDTTIANVHTSSNNNSDDQPQMQLQLVMPDINYNGSTTNKRPSSSSNASAVDNLDEPRKKRGRPRKYFTNYAPDFELLSRHSSTSRDDALVVLANRSSSDVSDGK